MRPRRTLEKSSSTSPVAAIPTTETAPTIEAPAAPVPACRTHLSIASVGDAVRRSRTPRTVPAGYVLRVDPGVPHDADEGWHG